MKQAHLLINLGTPQSPGYLDMFRYLAQFLGDKRVIDLPRLFWLPVLYGLILPVRAYKSGHTYAQIWDAKKGSPLRYNTQALAKKIGAAYAMRYGHPSISSTLDNLVNQGHKNIRVTPLYPQYAGATVGTTLDAVERWQQKNPAIKITVTPPWYNHPAYITALAKSIKAQKQKTVVVSFHGLPKRTIAQGDVYEQHCRATFHALRKKLPGSTLILAYQSRFGRAEWLTPATAEILQQLPGKGHKNIAVIAPGFACDCVETLEELGLRGKQTFLQNGGKTYTLIPCLNAAGANVLAKII